MLRNLLLLVACFGFAGWFGYALYRLALEIWEVWCRRSNCLQLLGELSKAAIVLIIFAIVVSLAIFSPVL